jgi:hypothetical protein
VKNRSPGSGFLIFFSELLEKQSFHHKYNGSCMFLKIHVIKLRKFLSSHNLLKVFIKNSFKEFKGKSV